ncbi:hypothetical protein UPYG_G00053080 [Umbra pygmaea]|uniref:C2H2-type domain-containing protein n=1 Tax=Umbra pygmaea TaxID=75934 RepID=A0ABD0XMU1_UMBPY
MSSLINSPVTEDGVDWTEKEAFRLNIVMKEEEDDIALTRDGKTLEIKKEEDKVISLKDNFKEVKPGDIIVLQEDKYLFKVEKEDQDVRIKEEKLYFEVKKEDVVVKEEKLYFEVKKEDDVVKEEKLQFKVKREEAISRVKDVVSLKEEVIEETVNPTICSTGHRFTQSKFLNTKEKSLTAENTNRSSHLGKLEKLKEHESKKICKKPYHCLQCKKSFTQAERLKVHERIQTEEKPYHCLQCGKSYFQAGSLKLHEKIHTGKPTLVYSNLQPGKP